MRIGVGGFFHETNTFAPGLTELDDFVHPGDRPGLKAGAAILEDLAGPAFSIGAAIEAIIDAHHEPVPLLWAAAIPGPIVSRSCFEAVSTRLVGCIEDAGPLDALYLELHGAMVALGQEDGEGELLERIRWILGPDVPIVASLDFHANLSPRMADLATVLVAYRTYPHIDMARTGVRAIDALLTLAGGGLACRAFRQIPYLLDLTAQCTMLEPAAGFYQRLAEIEASTGCTCCMTFGFAGADVHDCDPAFVVYGRSQHDVDQAASRIESDLLAIEDDFSRPRAGPQEVIARALEIGARTGRPVILADTQDNPGAGGSCDTTGILRGLIEARAKAIVALICDPAAARAAADAGEGADLVVAVGGKSPWSVEAPVLANWRVERVFAGLFENTGPVFHGIVNDIGPVVVLRTGQVHVIVASRRFQTMDRSLLLHLGFDLDADWIIALKSSVHFRADFSDLTGDVVVCVSAGHNPADLRKAGYRNVRPGVRL